MNFVLSLEHKATANTKIYEHTKNKNVTDIGSYDQHTVVFNTSG